MTFSLLDLPYLLKWLTELREKLTYVYQFDKAYDRGWASQVSLVVKNLPANAGGRGKPGGAGGSTIPWMWD